MLSYAESLEIVSLGLHDDTYLDRQFAREEARKEQERQARNRLRRISARLHKLAHEAWREDDYHTMEACLEAASALDRAAPPTARMARRYEDQAITRWHYEHRDRDRDW